MMELNGYMKTVMMLIIGVVLIAGVLTPIFTSLANDSGSGLYRNTDGSPMVRVSDLMEMYSLDENGNQAYGITNQIDPDGNGFTYERGAYTYVATYPEQGEDQIKYTEISYPIDTGIYVIPLFISNLVYVYWDFDNTLAPSVYQLVIRWVNEGTGNIYYQILQTEDGEFLDFNIAEGKINFTFSGENEYTSIDISGIDTEQSFIYHPKGDWRCIGRILNAESELVPQTIRWTGDDMYMFTTGNDLGNDWLYCKPYPPSWNDVITTLDETVSSYQYAVVDFDSGDITEFDKSGDVYYITTSNDIGVGIMVDYGGEEHYLMDQFYIAPTSDGSDGSGLSDTTVALLTVIPLIMLTGLILITVKAFIKRE